jgi:hypothetical protein
MGFKSASYSVMDVVVVVVEIQQRAALRRRAEVILGIGSGDQAEGAAMSRRAR